MTTIFDALVLTTYSATVTVLGDGICMQLQWQVVKAPAHIPQWGDLDAPAGTPERLPEWCLSQPVAPLQPGEAVYLSAHVYLRIYAEDKSELSKLDIAHWLT